MKYQKPWKSFEEQLQLLKVRGMKIGEPNQARSYLERIGYYRLSAYWYPFRTFQLETNKQNNKLILKAQDEFHPNTHFLDVVNLYLFDKSLRLSLTDALERIEIALRVDMAYLLGTKDAFAYRDKTRFHPTFANKKFRGKPAFETWQEKYSGLLKRSKEDFVKHFHRRYPGEDLPIWIAIEIWDFGAMSQLFSMMQTKDQTQIAQKYGVQDFSVFASWLRSLNYLRNIVAHHSRLWNRNIIDQPKLPNLGQIKWCDNFIGKQDLIAKPFLLIAIVRHLILVICPNTHWHTRLKQMLEGFPELKSEKTCSIKDMGAPENWQEWWTQKTPA
ncbi:Abi family protein [Marinomonas spartinae]|uniref:Abi family protein n=1 Tax=Marinomonas spartinae TaxID=1792290 RepID=UPI0018F1B60B|nr:Abi family protein [Marinomonas spartinae]MBJ7553768.1 Abi family protein [Marinomonas spartinae]